MTPPGMEQLSCIPSVSSFIGIPQFGANLALRILEFAENVKYFRIFQTFLQYSRWVLRILSVVMADGKPIALY